MTNRFSIALKDAADFPQLEKLTEENSVDILGSDLDGWYELACTNLSAGNALEMGNLFYETGLFELVGYDLGARGRIANINEPLYQNGTLWHLGNNTTNSSAHINYIAARAIVPQASSSVKVAIIDAGVQYGHSDLYNVFPGWDAETQSSPNQVSYNHGTQVTGFIAAIPNNGQAVAGVAYGATILPISFRLDAFGNIPSSYEVMVRAINRAVSEGAKVINCSWHYSDNRVVNAVKSALDNGRIVVFASGNSNGAVSSPANSDSRIIVVGAINKTGNRAYFSNYGSQLDVVAPGEYVVSTEVGSGYAYNYGIGTSFAAPQVAGVAALMLSKNPNLTSINIANIIESTAQKVGGYSYSPSSHNGTWNNQMGHGLVNAYAAVSGASHSVSLPKIINGSEDMFTQIQKTYSYSGGSIPSGSAFSGWTINPNTGTVNVVSGNNAQITFSSAGKYTVTANFTMPGNIPYVISKTVYVAPLPVFGPMIGPDVVYYGQTYVSYNLTRFQGFTYTWGSSGTLTQVSNNGLSEGLFNVQSSGGGSYETVHCTVTASDGTVVGIFYMNVTVM